MSLKFKQEDFLNVYGSGTREYIVNRANDIFQEWLAKQTVIYGKEIKLEEKTNLIFYYNKSGWRDECNEPSTHKARLVCITPIEHKCPTCGK